MHRILVTAATLILMLTFVIFLEVGMLAGIIYFVRYIQPELAPRTYNRHLVELQFFNQTEQPTKW